jgi:hypothetical protein
MFLGFLLYKAIAPKIIKFCYLNHTAVWVFGIILCFLALLLTVSYIWNKYVELDAKKMATANVENSVYLGKDEKDEKVYLREEIRTSHTQVIGTTNAGKTESIILPWAISDIENGNGFIIIDGKSDKKILDKLYSYVCKKGREKDFRLFSLYNTKESSNFNPLIGDSPMEVSERVFSSFPMDNSYYKAVQSQLFLNIISLIMERKVPPTFSLVFTLLSNFEYLREWVDESQDKMVQHSLYQFLALDESERIRQISGLKANLSNFVYGETSKLFNTEKPEIDFTEALEKNYICYFQLPTLLCPYLAEATGKLVLQCFQSAISKRHQVSGKEQKFFSCFLDDFQDYIYPGFGALLNKSRSANIGVVFSHQSIGDLEKVGSDFAKVVLTNTNVKIVMRSNDPISCEYFSKSFGTKTGIKKTERTKRTFLQDRTTGEASTREVEEFIYHPNEIKNLKLGEAIVAIPTLVGMIHKKIKLKKKDDLKAINLPIPEKIPYRIEKYFAQDEPKKITQIKGKT